MSINKATIVGLNTGEGWLYEHWDANVGEIVDVTTNPQTGSQMPVKEGDVKFSHPRTAGCNSWPCPYGYGQ